MSARDNLLNRLYAKPQQTKKVKGLKPKNPAQISPSLQTTRADS